MASAGYKSISLPDEAYEKLQKIAENEKRSMSAQVTMLIEKAYTEASQ